MRKFLRLSGSDRWLLIKITGLSVMIWLGLRLLPFQSMRRWLGRFSKQGEIHPRPGFDAEAARISTVVDQVGRHFLGSDSCFPQALAGELLLKRSGYDAELYIGVLKEADGSLGAHAWVEMDGKVVIGGPRSRVDKYTVLPNLDQGKS